MARELKPVLVHAARDMVDNAAAVAPAPDWRWQPLSRPHVTREHHAPTAHPRVAISARVGLDSPALTNPVPSIQARDKRSSLWRGGWSR
jgi:hypothetical protein